MYINIHVYIYIHIYTYIGELCVEKNVLKATGRRHNYLEYDKDSMLITYR